MSTHQRANYNCPFCRVVGGEDIRDDYTKQSDVVYRDADATAWVSSAWWPNNPGHVIVVPNAHHESVYDIPDAALAAVQIVGKRIALALKAAYESDGTSFRQHNELAGNQEIWHYHLHVFPRYIDDDLYVLTPRRRDTTPDERAPYAEKLRRHLARA